MTSAPGEPSTAVRFHLDENLSPEIALALGTYGIDATSSQSAQLLRAGDDIQFQFAQSSGRVFVTRDKDFVIAAARTSDHPGVVFLPGPPHSIGEIVRILILVANCSTVEELRGSVQYM